MGRFETHTLPAFNAATAGAGATLAVLVGFLAETWAADNKPLNQATAIAIYIIGSGLGPFLVKALVDSFTGVAPDIPPKWASFYRHYISLSVFVVMFIWTTGLVYWLFFKSTRF